MTNSNQAAWQKVLMSWVAMLVGLGLLLAELLTGYLHHVVPQFVVWAISLLLLLVSVWGMKTLLEVHLFDFDDDIYGRHVHVNFIHKLRDERRFDSFDALKTQILRDAEQARAYFGG